eukprot:gene5723-1021_t
MWRFGNNATAAFIQVASYTRDKFTSDMISGCTVALMVIPQGLAYSSLAGVPPQHGLYAAWLGVCCPHPHLSSRCPSAAGHVLVYILFGTSNVITIGPTALLSTMVGISAARLPGFSPTELDANVKIVSGLAFGAGIWQLLLGCFNVQALTNVIGRAVINGFTAAAIIIITTHQLGPLLGLTYPPGITTLWDKWLYLASFAVPVTRPLDLLMGVGCVLTLFFLQQARKLVAPMSALDRVLQARNALVIISAAVICHAFPNHTTMGRPNGMHVVSPFPSGLVVGIPHLSAWQIWAESLFVAFLGFLESFSLAHAFSTGFTKPDSVIEPGQELVAGTVPRFWISTSHLSNHSLPSGYWTALVVVLSLLFLTPAFAWIPHSALAASIVVSVVQLVEFEYPVEQVFPGSLILTRFSSMPPYMAACQPFLHPFRMFVSAVILGFEKKSAKTSEPDLDPHEDLEATGVKGGPAEVWECTSSPRAAQT